MEALDRDEALEAADAGEPGEEDRRHAAGRDLADQLVAVEPPPPQASGQADPAASPSPKISVCETPCPPPLLKRRRRAPMPAFRRQLAIEDQRRRCGLRGRSFSGLFGVLFHLVNTARTIVDRSRAGPVAPIRASVRVCLAEAALLVEGGSSSPCRRRRPPHGGGAGVLLMVSMPLQIVTPPRPAVTTRPVMNGHQHRLLRQSPSAGCRFCWRRRRGSSRPGCRRSAPVSPPPLAVFVAPAVRWPPPRRICPRARNRTSIWRCPAVASSLFLPGAAGGRAKPEEVFRPPAQGHRCPPARREVAADAMSVRTAGVGFAGHRAGADGEHARRRAADVDPAEERRKLLQRLARESDRDRIGRVALEGERGERRRARALAGLLARLDRLAEGLAAGDRGVRGLEARGRALEIPTP